MLRTIVRRFNELLHAPMKVLVLCVGFASVALILDGTLFRLWNLHREHQKIEENIKNVKVASINLEHELKRAKEIEFVERQARDRFDLVEENDLVFVFSHDSD